MFYKATVNINTENLGARIYKQVDSRSAVVGAYQREYLAQHPGVQTVPSYEPGKKSLILEFMCTFLKDEGITYGSGDAGEEQEQLERDAQRRYNMTQILISRFCTIQFSNRPVDFRWSNLSVQDRYIHELILEDFVWLALPRVEDRMPIHLAYDSWVVRSMISIKIRNFLQASKRAIVSIINASNSISNPLLTVAIICFRIPFLLLTFLPSRHSVRQAI